MKNAINTILLLILLIKIIRFRYLFHNAVPHRNKFLKIASDTCHHMHQTIIYFRVHLLHAKFHGKICTCMYHQHVSSACAISMYHQHYHQHVSSAFITSITISMYHQHYHQHVSSACIISIIFLGIISDTIVLYPFSLCFGIAFHNLLLKHSSGQYLSRFDNFFPMGSLLIYSQFFFDRSITVSFVHESLSLAQKL